MRLTELLELTELPEETEALLEGETLTREEEDRILAKTLAKAGLTPPPHRKGEGHVMKRSRFGLMLLAGVVCAGAVVASAAGYFTMDRGLARHLGAGEAEAALVSQAGSDLGQSCTAEGWTVTASQVLGDKTQMRVLLEVTAPEGTVLGEGNYRLELAMLDPAVTFTIDDVADDDPTDNRLSFVLSSIQAKDYRGRTVKFHMGGLSRYKRYTVEELKAGANPLDVDKLVTADFDLSFKLDYQDTSVTCRPGTEIDTANGKIRVDEITLSPLSMFMKLSGEGTVIRPGTRLTIGGEVSDFRMDDRGSIVMADPEAGAEWSESSSVGDNEESTMAIYQSGGALQSEFGITVWVVDRAGQVIPYQTGDTRPDSVTMTFRGIVDPADVAAVVIDGTEIPLNH